MMTARERLLNAQAQLARVRGVPDSYWLRRACETEVKRALDEAWGEQERERITHPTKGDMIRDWAVKHNVLVKELPTLDQCVENLRGMPWKYDRKTYVTLPKW